MFEPMIGRRKISGSNQRRRWSSRSWNEIAACPCEKCAVQTSPMTFTSDESSCEQISQTSTTSTTWLMSPARVGTVSAICGISDPLRDAGTPREAHRGPVCEGRFYARLRLRRWGEAVSPARGTGSVFGGHGAPARRPNARRRHSAAGAVAVSFALAACGGPAVTSGVTSTTTGAAASGDFGHLVTIGGDRRLYLECRGASGTCRPCSPQQVNGPHTYWSEPRGAR